MPRSASAASSRRRGNRVGVTETAAPELRPPTTLADVQRPVSDRLPEVRREIERIVSGDAPLLARAGGHLLATRGKMFRPTLVLLASATDDTPMPRAVTMAAVVELVHLATLVHDDAVDHSELRRGMPTLNALFSDQISVIMGDFLYSVALTQLTAMNDLAAIQALVEASTRMTVGELRQLSHTEPLAFGEEDYELLIRAKTASLIVAACHVGGLCGASRHIPVLRDYGDALGMAFQIADDLIDFTEASETTGKPAGLDVRERKVTLPLIAALRSISPVARARVHEVFAATEPTDQDVADVVAIVAESDGLEYARRRGEEFAGRAEGALRRLPATPARDALGDAIFYVMERHA